MSRCSLPPTQWYRKEIFSSDKPEQLSFGFWGKIHIWDFGVTDPLSKVSASAVWWWNNRRTYIWATDMTVLSFDWVIRQVLVSRHFRNISRARADGSSGRHSVTVSHFGFYTSPHSHLSTLAFTENLWRFPPQKKTDCIACRDILWYIFIELFIVAARFFVS